MIGSEGTLGVITELTLKLSGIPEAISGGVCPFPSVEKGLLQRCYPVHPVRHPGGARRTARRLASQGRESIFQAWTAGNADVVLEFHGTEATVAEQSERFGEIAEEFGGGPFEWATGRKNARGFGTRVTMPRCPLSRCGRVSDGPYGCLRADFATS